jgi:hypothetical protein
VEKEPDVKHEDIAVPESVPLPSIDMNRGMVGSMWGSSFYVSEQRPSSAIRTAAGGTIGSLPVGGLWENNPQSTTPIIVSTGTMIQRR